MLLFSSSRETTAQNPVYYNKDIAHKAIVSILAISSSVHASSGSQEIYLADISFRGTEHQLAKLVDLYPAYGYGVRTSLLRDHRKFRMRLARHEQCDVKGKQFFLSDDPNMVFNLSTRTELANHAEDVIPCYRITHSATHLMKK